MKKIEAPTLNDALLKASELFSVSVRDIEYETVQEPSKGFLGFGKKNAIIIANTKPKESPSQIEQTTQTTYPTKTQVKSPIDTQIKPTGFQTFQNIQEKTERSIPKTSQNTQPTSSFMQTDHIHSTKDSMRSHTSEDAIYNNFFQDSDLSTPPISTSKPPKFKDIHPHTSKLHTQTDRDLHKIALDVEQELRELFTLTPFKIDTIAVSVFDHQTLFVEFQGEDSALLIGKEGYRYKALSYMLFNWINAKYGLMLRLEIAEFLKNQEEMIHNYLVPIIQSIEETGKGQTRPLNGILAYIALRQLREHFPDKYVSFRNTLEGERYVIVNDFIKNYSV